MEENRGERMIIDFDAIPGIKKDRTPERAEAIRYLTERAGLSSKKDETKNVIIIDEFNKKDFIFTDKDLESYEPKIKEFLIINQVPKKEIGLLVGKRQSLKTWIAQLQAVCLASGSDCLGDKVPKKGKVLYLDLENDKDEIVSRHNAIKKGLNIKDKLDITYITDLDFRLDKPGTTNYQKFLEELDTLKPDMVFVDGIQRFLSFNVDKENELISNFFTTHIKPLIRKYGSTWIFIHHLRKSPAGKYEPDDLLDEVRGGSEITNIPRFIALCRKSKIESDDKVYFEYLNIKLSNYKKPEPKALSFEYIKGDVPKNDIVKISFEGVPEEVFKSALLCAENIKKYLLNKGLSEFQSKDITDASKVIGFGKTTINAGLNELKKIGILIKPKQGHWKINTALFDPNQTKLFGIMNKA